MAVIVACARKFQRRGVGYMQIVPGFAKISRVIGLTCATPSTIYENVPVLPLLKFNVTAPTAVATTLPGLNGTASKGGPAVLYRVPE
ncbi:MAG TPA: hypothetical protein VMM27_17155 [Casimicrobiaceae bacterium]|nr:hypothetical protein [Casimicrobiaceae bacterium]